MSLIVGLTGGIASGKSTVSSMFREFGIPVICADQIAKDVVNVGTPVYKQIVKQFGEQILNRDQTINRAKLGSVVFHNEMKRKQLNDIVHPAVREEMRKQQEKYTFQGEPIVVLDIPLLFESKLTHLVDKVIVVYVDDETQIKRLMMRNGFSKEEALARINAQMPLKEKVKKANEVIDNNGTIEETKEQLKNILAAWGFHV